MATEQKTVSGQLKLVPSATRSTVTAARRMIRMAAPGADEIAYQSKPPRSKSTMWKLARYAVDGTNVAGLGTFSTYAALFFYRGRELRDEVGLLEGSGKDSRFLRLRTPADAERPAVKRLVRDAFALERPKRWRRRSDAVRGALAK
jgi:hypothetical protein